MEEKKGTRLLTIGEMLEIRDKAFYNALCDELGLNRNLLRLKAVILCVKLTSNKQSKKTTRVMKLFNNEELKAVQLFQNEELMSFTDDKCLAYISGLTEREQQVISMRFALGEYNRFHKLQEVGEKLGLSPERVRQIEKRAIRKMREYVKSNLSSEEFIKSLEDKKRKDEEKLENLKKKAIEKGIEWDENDPCFELGLRYELGDDFDFEEDNDFTL